MVIDVALGIILAFVIIRFWAMILSLGLIFVIVAAILLTAGGVVYFLTTQEALRERIITTSVPAIVFLLGSFVCKLIAKRTVLTPDEIGVLSIIALFLTTTTAFFIWFIFKWAAEAGEPILLLFLAPLVGRWAWLWLKLSKLLKTRNQGVASAPNSA